MSETRVGFDVRGHWRYEQHYRDLYQEEDIGSSS